MTLVKRRRCPGLSLNKKMSLTCSLSALVSAVDSLCKTASSTVLLWRIASRGKLMVIGVGLEMKASLSKIRN